MLKSKVNRLHFYVHIFWLTTYNIYIISISWKIKIYPTLQVRIITSSALNVNPVSPKIFVPSIIVSELCFFEFGNGRCSMSSMQSTIWVNHTLRVLFIWNKQSTLENIFLSCRAWKIWDFVYHFFPFNLVKISRKASTSYRFSIFDWVCIYSGQIRRKVTATLILMIVYIMSF